MRQLIEGNRILWTWFKDHDDYNYRNTQLYSLTKKRLKNCPPLCLSIMFEGKNLSNANMPDFSQTFSINLSDHGCSGLIITNVNFL